MEKPKNVPDTRVRQFDYSATNGIRSSEMSANTGELAIATKPVKVALFLGSIVGLLILADILTLSADHLTGHSSVIIHKLVKLFDMGLEVNVPTFFSVLYLSLASLMLGLVTTITWKQKGRHLLEWSILTLGFLFLAFDEMASVHERLIEPTRSLLGIESHGLLYYAWVVPAFAGVALVGMGFLRFLIDLPARTRWAFMIGGAMFLGGAVGFELLEGMYGPGNLTYNTLVLVEESLEMGGIIVFICALLDYLSTQLMGQGLRFDISRDPASTEVNAGIDDLGLQS